MRYVIAHLIKGEAGEIHESITRDLAEKFDTFPLHERIPPHLTIKRWFEDDVVDIAQVRTLLNDFSKSHKQSGFKFGGFSHFGEDVIYVDVQPSKEMSATVRELMKSLHGIPKMTFDEFDEEEDDFHATVVMRALGDFDYELVWKYLNENVDINFDMKFDNIALLRREESKWVVDSVWELPN